MQDLELFSNLLGFLGFFRVWDGLGPRVRVGFLLEI